MNASSSPRSCSVRSSKAKSIGLLRLTGSSAARPRRDDRRHERADPVETLTDGQALHVAVVDALADHRELEAGEGRVPGVVGEVEAGALGVAPRQRGGRREAVVGRGRRDGVVPHAPALPVEGEQREVGERVAESRPSPSPAPRGGDRGRRRPRSRCPAGSRRARSTPAAWRARSPATRSASRAKPGTSRDRDAASCAVHRRTWRARYPSGRPKSARPTAAGSTTCRSARASTNA